MTNELRAIERELLNVIGAMHCDDSALNCDGETVESERCNYHRLVTSLLKQALERIIAVRVLEKQKEYMWIPDSWGELVNMTLAKKVTLTGDENGYFEVEVWFLADPKQSILFGGKRDECERYVAALYRKLRLCARRDDGGVI